MLYPYLIICDEDDPFNTAYFTEEMFAKGMVVFNLANGTFTTDGINWKRVEEDHL